MLSSFTGRSVEEIARDTDRDNVLSAAQALEYGIIDYVIPSKYQISAKGVKTMKDLHERF